MINAIDRALTEASKAARQQSAQMLNELNSASECMMAAKVIFEREMQAVRQLQADAERRAEEAMRNLDAALIQQNAVLVALRRQISDGEIVSGIMEGSKTVTSTEKPDDAAKNTGATFQLKAAE